MIEIRTFGGLWIASSEQPQAALTRPKPLALLAVLAACAPDPVARDKLLALLWPEHDAERGRNALNQTVFGIRRALGRPEMILGRGDLRLNLDHVSCDVAAFKTALAEGRQEEAVALYGGPFLDGFFLTGAPEFEHWVEETRGKLSRKVTASLRELAAAAERAGDPQAAAAYRWQITEIDPLDSTAALALVRTLAAAGDRARAVRFARRHEALLREEVGSGLDPAMADFVARLLAEGRSLPPFDPLEAPSARFEPEAVGAPTDIAPASTGQERTGVGEPPPLARRRSSSGRLIATAAILSLAAPVLLALRDRSSPAASLQGRSPLHTEVVAVLPFAVRGDSGQSYLRDGLVELISRRIDGAGGLRPVDPELVLRATAEASASITDNGQAAALARDLSATRFVRGEVLATATSLLIEASLYHRSPEVTLVAAASVSGPPGELVALVDRLAAQLLAAEQADGRNGAIDVASLGTRSLPALKSFLTAQQYRLAGRYPEALEHYQRAVREDSTFALAWYGLSNTADWSGRGDLVLPAAQRAADLGAQLAEHDRLLMRAHLAWREGRAEAAEKDYRLLLHLYPDDTEAWYQFGEVLFHDNSRRGRSFVEAREAFERVREFVPDDHQSLLHLVRIAARAGSPREVDSLTSVALRASVGVEAMELRALRAHAVGDTAAQAGSLTELAAADATGLYAAAWRVAVFAHDVEGAERILRLGSDPSRNRSLQVDARTPLPFVLHGLGRVRDAERELKWLEDTGGGAAMSARITRAILELGPTGRRAPGDLAALSRILESAVAAALREGTPADSAAAHEQACLAGVVAAEAGAAESAREWISRLNQVRAPADVARRARACSNSIVARLDLEAGRTAAGLGRLLGDRETWVPEMNTEILDRFLIAETLLGTGREQEAEPWYRSIADRGLDEIPFLAPAERRLGEIAERRGDVDAALGHYRKVVALWGHGDPEFRKQAEDVASRVRAMTAPAGGLRRDRPARVASPRGTR